MPETYSLPQIPYLPEYANYFALAIVTMLISQTIKFGIKFYLLGKMNPSDSSSHSGRKMNFEQFRHIYLWSSGIPSSHTAVLTVSLLALVSDLGRNNPMSFIFAVFAMLWIYEIYMQRKRYRALENLFEKTEETDPHLKLLKDLEGHDFIDIAAGALLGTVVFLIYTHLR